MKITKSNLQEMKDLVASGDTNLDQVRNTYTAATGKETTLNEEQLAAATCTEDDDDDLLVKNILDIQENGLEITEDEPAEEAESHEAVLGVN